MDGKWDLKKFLVSLVSNKSQRRTEATGQRLKLEAEFAAAQADGSKISGSRWNKSDVWRLMWPEELLQLSAEADSCVVGWEVTPAPPSLGLVSVSIKGSE